MSSPKDEQWRHAFGGIQSINGERKAVIEFPSGPVGSKPGPERSKPYARGTSYYLGRARTSRITSSRVEASSLAVAFQETFSTVGVPLRQVKFAWSGCCTSISRLAPRQCGPLLS